MYFNIRLLNIFYLGCLFIFSLSSVIAMEGKEEQLTASTFFRTRHPSDEPLQRKKSKKNKRSSSLKTLGGHRRMIQEAIINHAEQELKIMTSKTSKPFVEDYFIPWLITRVQKKPERLPKITLYIRSEESELITDALWAARGKLRSEEARKPKVSSFKGKGSKIRSTESSTFRRFNLFLKKIELVYTNLSKTIDHGQSNVLIVDDNMYVLGSSPWLSLTTATAGSLSPPLPADLCRFATITTGKEAKQLKDDFLETLDAALKALSADRRAYSLYMKDFLEARSKSLREEEDEEEDISVYDDFSELDLNPEHQTSELTEEESEMKSHTSSSAG